MIIRRKANRTHLNVLLVFVGLGELLQRNDGEECYVLARARLLDRHTADKRIRKKERERQESIPIRQSIDQSRPVNDNKHKAHFVLHATTHQISNQIAERVLGEKRVRIRTREFLRQAPDDDAEVPLSVHLLVVVLEVGHHPRHSLHGFLRGQRTVVQQHRDHTGRHRVGQGHNLDQRIDQLDPPRGSFCDVVQPHHWIRGLRVTGREGDKVINREVIH